MRSVKNKNLIIGITGPIGSGKSTVLNFFKEKGFNVISADQINKDLLENKKHIITINKLLFNEKSNVLDKTKIKTVIFNDYHKKTLLENYLHPLIIKEINKLAKKSQTITFVEAALLYESGFNNDVDLVIGVVAEEDVIIKRLKKRDNLTEAMIKNILISQKTKEFLKEKANYLVNNNYDLKETYLELETILKEIMEVNNGYL